MDGVSLPAVALLVIILGGGFVMGKQDGDGWAPDKALLVAVLGAIAVAVAIVVL